MAKPETYKGADAVKVKCLREYIVRGGDNGGGKPVDDIEFEAGKTYTLSPGSAAHMLRKVYNVFDKPKPGQTRGDYIGTAPFFEPADSKPAPKAAAKADAE